MLKKFLIGAIAVIAFGVVMHTAMAALDFGPTTLKVGSTGVFVSTLQQFVGATADGSFGPMTKAKVMAWQATNGLTADGVFGPLSKAKANATVGTYPSGCSSTLGYSTTTGLPCTTAGNYPAGCTSEVGYSPTTGAKCDSSTTGGGSSGGALSGGAGDATLTHYSTSEKSKIKEGDSDVKVLGFRVEASDSDIAVNNVKVKIENTDAPSSSYKITKYLDSVDIYQGSTKVGSADAADFTKASDDSYSKSIAVSNAVVRDGDKDPFYVVFNAVDSIDSENSTASLTVGVESFRFTDGSGVVTTATPDPAVSNVVTLDDSSDVLTLKSSSNNPDDVTVTVDENNTTDEVLALAFKLKAGSDSSDITLDKLPITLEIAGAGASVTSSEKVIDSVVVKLDGKEITADATNTSINNAGSDTALYTADLSNEDITIAQDDTLEAKVYITFVEQGGTGSGKNYTDGSTVVTAHITGTAITAESANDDTISPTSGTQTGAALTLSTSSITLSGMSWTTTSGSSTGTLDFYFSLEAGDNDVENLTISDVVTSENTTNAGGKAAGDAAGVLTKISGDATTNSTGNFTISSGDTANFRIRYTTTVSGSEVQIKTIKGQTVPDNKQLSGTFIAQ